MAVEVFETSREKFPLRNDETSLNDELHHFGGRVRERISNDDAVWRSLRVYSPMMI